MSAESPLLDRFELPGLERVMRSKAKQKLLVVHIASALDFGGVEKHLETIALNADSSGLEHMFCAISSGGATFTSISRLGRNVKCLGENARIPSFRAIVALYLFFRAVRPAVVHTHGAEANFHGILAAYLARVPVRVAEEIGIPTHSKLAKFVFSWVYRLADRVIGISDSVSRWLVENGEAPERKVIRLYNPVALPQVERHGERRSGVFSIAFVGRLEPVKNPLALVEACYLLRSRCVCVELRLVGDGSDRKKIEEYVAEKGLEGVVSVLGFRADPWSAVAGCDLYVQPSLSEGFGIAQVEAMSLGLPVLASPVGGSPEIIDHGKTGWLLDDCSAQAIARAIQKVIELGETEVREIGLRAKRSVADRFGAVKYLSDLDGIYLDVFYSRVRSEISGNGQ